MNEGEDIRNNKAALMAAKRLQRRRERNKPSASLLDILKQSREAAGLPLNAVNTYQPETVHESPEQITSLTPSNHLYNNERSPEKPSPKQDTAVDVEPDWDDWNGCESAWQNNKTLIECNLYMLTEEIGCDVTLLVGEGQETILGHSYVLSSRSNKLAYILSEQRNLAEKLIPIPDIEPNTFRMLLRYLYCGEIELDVDSATALIPAAYIYGPGTLKVTCFRYLLTELNSDNVCITLEHAHKYHDVTTHDKCMNFIFVNAVDVLRSPNFHRLCRKCVENIVKSDDLNAKEFHVFEALATWASRKCSEKKMQPSDENRRNVLDQLLYHVRFANMDVVEFTQRISHTDILTRDEKVSLYQFFHGETQRLPPMFTNRSRHEHSINHDLVSKTFAKGEPKQYHPDVLSHSKFSVIPYKHTQENETFLPVTRVIRFQGVENSWQLKGPDAIGFRVSKPIMLRGCQMFGSQIDPYTYDVEIVVYDDSGDIIRHEEKTVVTENTLKVYDVILTKPVSVPVKRTFTVQLKSRGKPTFRGVNGLDIVETEGVCFQFFDSNKSLNGTDITIGQIPTILFSKL